MAKELPYFKFFVSEWSDGDITLEDMEVQGLFINLCAYYWSNECNLTLTKAKKRFRNVSELGFENLIENKIISVKNDVIKINFLNEQRKDRGAKSLINRQNGSKGGRPKKNPSGFNSLTENITETKAKQKAIREDKKREDKKREDNSIPAYDDFLKHAVSKIENLDKKAVKLKFDSWIENDWKDGNNKPILNWKAKLTNTVGYLPLAQSKKPNFKIPL